MRRRAALSKPPTLSGPELRRLAWFRYQLRRYLRFSERAARAAGLTPQQYQLLLGVAGHTGRGWATVSELAEFLQERHNAVVGLVERAVRRRLVQKKQSARDRRFVRVLLTRHGRKALRDLAQQHLEELGRVRSQFLRALQVRSRAVHGAGRA